MSVQECLLPSMHTNLDGMPFTGGIAKVPSGRGMQVCSQRKESEDHEGEPYHYLCRVGGDLEWKSTPSEDAWRSSLLCVV